MSQPDSAPHLGRGQRFVALAVEGFQPLAWPWPDILKNGMRPVFSSPCWLVARDAYVDMPAIDGRSPPVLCRRRKEARA
jgi:hypothetical protein